MSVHTQLNTSLKIVLDTKEYQCQIINAELSLPGTAVGETVETACPDGKVVEPGSTVNGSLTGEAYTDTTADGFWTALASAYTSGAEVTYELDWFPETAAEHLIFNGKAKVETSPTLSFAKPGMSRHPFQLTLLSAAMTRPTAP